VLCINVLDIINATECLNTGLKSLSFTPPFFKKFVIDEELAVTSSDGLCFVVYGRSLMSECLPWHTENFYVNYKHSS
jgi:hypothetical protein